MGRRKMGCGPSKDKKDPKGAPEEKPAATKPSAAAKPAAETKPAAKPAAATEQRANNTASHQSEALKDLISDYFNRYDLDGSGTINSKEELKQLCTNLVVKLDLDMEVADIDDKVTKAGAFKDEDPANGQEWDVQAFSTFFMNADNFKEVPQDWENGDESDEDDDQHESTKPFFKGTYQGELTDESGEKKYTIKMRKGTGPLDPKTKHYATYVTEDLPVFTVRVRVDKEDGATGKKPLKARHCCDSVGYYNTSGHIEGNKIHYEMSYDVDNNATTKEPKLVLEGTVSDDGNKITGTWVQGEELPADSTAMTFIGLEGVGNGKFTLDK